MHDRQPPIAYTQVAASNRSLAGVSGPALSRSSRGPSWYRTGSDPSWSFTTLLARNDPLNFGRECPFFSYSGVFAARSRHAGGVTAAVADGSASFVNDSVDISAWRRLEPN